MANIIADRVLETSTTTGLGSYTLLGPIVGFRTVASVATTGDTFTYCAEDINPSTGQNLGGWEVGLATVVGLNTIQRTQIYSSSNSNAAVNWAAGTRRITLSVTTNTIAVGSQSAGLMSAADKTKLDGLSGSPTATSVSFTPAGNIAATNVQAALAELDSEKQPVGTYATGGGTATGTNTGDNATNSQYSGLVTNATHTGDATGSGTLTVVGVNGTLLSGLGTGILKNTTGTGVPSIAAAGTDYQAPLVSGTNIKTINGESVLGSGDMTISGGGGADVEGWVSIAPITWSGTTQNVDVALDWTTYKAFKVVGTASFGTDTNAAVLFSVNGGSTYSSSSTYSYSGHRTSAGNSAFLLDSSLGNTTSLPIFFATSGSVGIKEMSFISFQLLKFYFTYTSPVWIVVMPYDNTGVAYNGQDSADRLTGIARFKDANPVTHMRIVTGASTNHSVGNLKLLGLPV